MSVVSTCILLVDWDPGGVVDKAFDFTGTSIGEAMNMTKLRSCDPDHVGGYKCAETEIYIGAFNHFDHEGWFEHLDTLTWDDPRMVMAVVQSSDIEFIKVWRPKDSTDDR